MEAGRASAAVLALTVLPLQLAGAQFAAEAGCPVGDQRQLSECLTNGLERLRPFFRTGIPENGIPPGDPLFLREIAFSRDGLDALYSNVIVHGFSAFQLHSLNVDPAARSVTFDLTVPEVDLSGDYDVTGNFLLLVVTSSGNFTSHLKGVDVSGAGDLVVQPSQERGGTSHVQMANLNVRLEIAETQHQIDYSQETNPIIGETVRHLVTNNDRLLLEEVRPEIEAKIAELMARLVNRVLTVLPVESVHGPPPAASQVAQVALPAPATGGSTAAAAIL